MKITIYKRCLLLLLAPLAFAVTKIMADFPEAVEHFYSRKVHYFLREVSGRLTGYLPFSLAEFVLVFGSMGLILYISHIIFLIAKRKVNWRRQVSLSSVNLFCFLAVIYAWFVFTCGLNYHRQTFAEYIGLDVQPTSVEELSAMCEKLVLDMNDVRSQLQENSEGICLSTFDSSYKMAEHAAASYTNIADEYALLGGYTPIPKLVLLSRVMSSVNITGFYFPYTMECNVNVDIPSFEIPATMMHEISHFKGFMREQEANFIAYLTCLQSGDDFFRYSGIRLAAIHATNALYSADKAEYKRVMQLMTDAVRRDMRANSDYWRRFETPVAEVATAMNDTYLRVNNQESGVKSYGEMVDLLLAYYRR